MIVRTERDDFMSDIGAYSFGFVFTARCSSCGEVSSVRGPGKCPACDAPFDANAVATVRTSIRERRQVFKGRLSRLAQRMHEVTDGPLEFKPQGDPLSPEDHFTNMLLPTKQAVLSLDEDISRLVSSQDWTSNQPERIGTFTKLVQTLDDALAKVPALLETMPPLEWRAVHRELTRAFVSSVRGHIFMALTMSAADGDEAAKIQANAAEAKGESEKEPYKLISHGR